MYVGICTYYTFYYIKNYLEQMQYSNKIEIKVWIEAERNSEIV